jgi:hypothetical protein
MSIAGPTKKRRTACGAALRFIFANPAASAYFAFSYG